MSPPSKYFRVQHVVDKAANDLTFKIMENAANGDCLFMSITQFLMNDKGFEVPDLVDLRNKIVDYISHSSNWNRFVDSIIFNLENFLPILRVDEFSDECKQKIYKNYMNQPLQYGTIVELQAASEIFDFVFVVFRKEIHRTDGQNYETRYKCYSSEDHSRKPKMFLLFSGKPSAGHFQFMLPHLSKNIFVVPPGEYKTVAKYAGPDDSIVLSVKKFKDTFSACPLCGLRKL